MAKKDQGRKVSIENSDSKITVIANLSEKLHVEIRRGPDGKTSNKLRK